MAGALILSNCSSSQIVTEQVPKTVVRLDQGNYKVVATQVKGESSGFHVLSAIPTSLPTGLDDIKGLFGGGDGGFALKSATKAEALRDLYKKAGDITHRATAFINMREEKTGTNFLIFSRPKYVITADLIEFVR